MVEAVSVRLSSGSFALGGSSYGSPGRSPPSRRGSILAGPNMVLGTDISSRQRDLLSQVQGMIYRPRDLETYGFGP